MDAARRNDRVIFPILKMYNRKAIPPFLADQFIAARPKIQNFEISLQKTFCMCAVAVIFMYSI